nr:hypothetical protein [Tanacetum cinerariifolium]
MQPPPSLPRFTIVPTSFPDLKTPVYTTLTYIILDEDPKVWYTLQLGRKLVNRHGGSKSVHIKLGNDRFPDGARPRRHGEKMKGRKGDMTTYVPRRIPKGNLKEDSEEPPEQFEPGLQNRLSTHILWDYVSKSTPDI